MFIGDLAPRPEFLDGYSRLKHRCTPHLRGRADGQFPVRRSRRAPRGSITSSMFSAGNRSRRALAGRLLERDWELDAIERGLAAPLAGTGAVIAIEGESGSGKTQLLGEAEKIALESGMRVLGARAAELEREFAFGLAIQLFEPLWLAADSERRSAWLSGPSRGAGALFDGSITDLVADTARHYPVIHGLLWMTREIEDPVAILVDDAHWSDPPSLRFLAYLAERVRQLPVAIVLTAQQGAMSAEPRAFASLRRSAQASVLRTRPLSLAAVTTMVHRHFPNADAAFCEACARISGGNPFLLLEFLGKLREEEKSPQIASTEGLAAVLPEKVTAAMAARLDTAPGSARALARAVAVLGSAPVQQGAAVAEIDPAEAARAADTLAGAGLLHPGVPLSFVHPLLREAVLATLSPLERSQLHGRAARAMADEGADAERIAFHLLEAPPGQDEWAMAALREAASAALAAGRSDDAVAVLERALAEHPSEELRVRLALSRSDLLHGQGRYGKAAELLRGELAGARSRDERLADELDAAYVSAASLAPGGARVSRAVRERMLATLPDSPTPRQRRALARSLVYESLLGLPRTDVRRLADVAWNDGQVLADLTDDDLGFLLLPAALLVVDELERVIEISDSVARGPLEGRGQVPAAMFQVCRAQALAEQGLLAQAAAGAAAVLADPAGQCLPYATLAEATLALCHLERGELDQAEAALSRLANSSVPEAVRQSLGLELRARLRLAQHRPEEALSDAFMAAEAVRSDLGSLSPAALPWRSTAALAHLALGQTEEARRLAAEALQEAQRIGATRAVIRALRVLGLATAGPEGVELLALAVELGAAGPLRLEYIHALVDLGGRLRRTNRRADARAPLRRGLELAEQAGAPELVRRARTELLATRSRRDVLALSGPESLTASQRRVAELGAKGLTTREIAESLFVKPKTVEFHLRQIYRKLDITSRDQLGVALRDEEDR